MARFNIVIKCIFYVAIVLGAGLAIENLTRIKHYKLGQSLALRDVVYNASSDLEFEDFKTTLRKHYFKCLTNPSKPFCLMSAHKKLKIFQGNRIHNPEVVKSRLKRIAAGLHAHASRIHSLLLTFAKLMEVNDVKIMLIEPSILFCLLSDEKKNDMLLKGFNPTRLHGSRNVITVGVLSEDSAKLEDTNLTKEAFSAGFQLVKNHRFIGNGSYKSFESVHYIFRQQDIAVHVIVFYPREAYWWHSGIDATVAIQENLLFSQDGIFEKFVPLPLNLDDKSIRGIFLPHDIRYFMLQISSSKFVKCNGSFYRSSYVLEHPTLTVEELNNRAEVALKELKSILAPQLVLFWLWSDTLLGWSSKCNIFYYATTLELAVTHKSIEGLNLDALIADNDNLEVSNNTNSAFEYRVQCHGLEINLSILHEDGNSLRTDSNDGFKAFNLTYPAFTLCSTNIYNLKTQVPCVSEDVLKVEQNMTSIEL